MDDLSESSAEIAVVFLTQCSGQSLLLNKPCPFPALTSYCPLIKARKFHRTKGSYNSQHSVFFYPYVHNLKWPLKCLCTSGLPFLNATTWNLNDFQGESLAWSCRHWPAKQCSYSRTWCWRLWHAVFKAVKPELSLSMDKHTGHSKTLQDKSLLLSCREAYFFIPLLKGLAESSWIWNPVFLLIYALSHIPCIR